MVGNAPEGFGPISATARQAFRKRIRSRNDDDVENAAHELASLGESGDELLVDFFHEGTKLQRMLILAAMTDGVGQQGDRLLRDVASGVRGNDREDRQQAIVVGADRLGEAMLPILLSSLASKSKLFQLGAVTAIVRNDIRAAKGDIERWLRREVQAKSRRGHGPPVVPEVVGYLFRCADGESSVNRILDILRPRWGNLLDDEIAGLSAMWPGRDVRTDRTLPFPPGELLPHALKRQRPL
jgi:hypothetical protein